MKKILAIDWGRKHLGLALSDAAQRWVFPRGELSSAEALMEIAALVKDEDVGEIVVGLPLPLQRGGAQGRKQLGEVRAFARTLEDRCAVPVHLFDERFTSVRASARGTHSAGTHERSAQIILEDFLKRRQYGK